jgi:hypothetical protein
MPELHKKPQDNFFILNLTSEENESIHQNELEMPPNITTSKGKCAACAVCLACWFSAAAWMLTAAGTVAK